MGLWSLELPARAQPVAAQAASPNTVEPPSLTQLTSQAALARLQRENLALAAARQELAASRAEVIAAGLLPNPRLFVGSAWVMHGVPSGGKQEYQIGAEQDLALTGLSGVRRDAAQAASTAAELEFATLGWELVYQMRTAYLNLQLAEARIQVIVAGLQDLERVRAVIDARARAGANSAYDLLRLSVERTRRSASEANAQSDLIRARTVLAEAIGPSLQAAAITVQKLGDDPREPTLSPKDMLRYAWLHRPEVAAARAQVTARELRTRALARQYVPSPQLSLGYARWSNVITDQGSRDGGALLAGLTIPIPLFDHGQGTLDRSRAETLAASSRRTMTEVTIQRQVEQTARELQLRLQAWQSFRERTPGEAEKMREIAETAYREGRATILELLDAYNAHLAAQELGLELRGQALRATLALEWAVGPRSSAFQ